jgi:type IV secretory pathway VirB4 component
MPNPQNPAMPPTQKQVEIEKIKDGVVYLKNGQIIQIIAVGGINFDLKSQEEQNVIISGFQNFLNSLDFKTQFFIHSRKINIQSYLDKINERKNMEKNELLKIQIEEYMNFIKNFVESNAIIKKDFFVVVPYSATDLSKKVKDSPFSQIFNLFKKDKKSEEEKNAKNNTEAIEQLRLRSESIIVGITQLGLKAIPLEDEELKELFYNLYNPQLIEKKNIKNN